MNIAYAIIEHQESYSDFYAPLLDYIKQHFENVESGIQGDAWIWITDDGDKVALDSFSAMQFEIKSDGQNALLSNVIEIVQKKFPIRIYDDPIER